MVDAADSKSAEGNLVGVRFPSRVLWKRLFETVFQLLTGVFSCLFSSIGQILETVESQ